MDLLHLFWILSGSLLLLAIIWMATDPRSTQERIEYFLELPQILHLSSYVLIIVAQYHLTVTNQELPVNSFFQMIGIILVTAGFSLAIWAKLTMHTSWGPPGQLDKNRQNKLITTGPFVFSRNPIYLGLVTFGLGYFLALKSPLIIFLLIPVYYIVKAVPMEEQLLEEYFGEEYVKYKNKVNRWLGRR